MNLQSFQSNLKYTLHVVGQMDDQMDGKMDGQMNLQTEARQTKPLCGTLLCWHRN